MDLEVKHGQDRPIYTKRHHHVEVRGFSFLAYRCRPLGWTLDQAPHVVNDTWEGVIQTSQPGPRQGVTGCLSPAVALCWPRGNVLRPGLGLWLCLRGCSIPVTSSGCWEKGRSRPSVWRCPACLGNACCLGVPQRPRRRHGWFPNRVPADGWPCCEPWSPGSPELFRAGRKAPRETLQAK